MMDVSTSQEANIVIGYNFTFICLKGVLSLSMNERFQAEGGFIGIIEWVLGQRDGQWMGFVLRDAVVKATE